jgi:hypothetical protein
LSRASDCRIDRQKTWLRVVTGTVIGVVTVANLLAAVRLVVDILTSNTGPAAGCCRRRRCDQIRRTRALMAR